jgi:hypothetical protein
LIEADEVIPVDQPNRLETGITTRPNAAADRKAPMQLIASDGAVCSGYALFERVVRSVRLLWPVALLTWIPGFSGLGQRFFPQRSRRSLTPARARKEAVA